MKGKNVPKAILMHWYTCGRKRPIATETIAHLYAPEKHAYKCPYGDHWHVGRRMLRNENHDHWHNRKMNARKAWDQQAYKPFQGARRCAYDPPCPNVVIDVMVPLNPRMWSRSACALHALPQVDPMVWGAS